MGKKKKNKKNKKKLNQEAATQPVPGQNKEQDKIPPTQDVPKMTTFSGTFQEFKDMVAALDNGSGLHYFDLPFAEISVNVTTKRSLKKKGRTEPGQYTWPMLKADFEAAKAPSEDHPETEEITKLLDFKKYKRKAFKAYLETETEFDREDIDAAVALIPKKKVTGVRLNQIMMQNLKMPSAEVNEVLKELMG